MSDTDRIRLKRLEGESRHFAERLARLEARVLEAPAPAAVRPDFALAREAPAASSPHTHGQAGELDDRSAVLLGTADLLVRAARGPAIVSSAPAPAEADRHSHRRFRPEDGLSFEDMLAGRFLAWAGALAVFVGIVLLFGIAISRGWIDEGVRTVFALLFSSVLVAAGSWSHERRGRTDASRAASAAGLAGLFLTVVVAARIYELIPVGFGVALGFAIGGLSTGLALRWRDTGIAALGIVGGLLAPVLVDAPQDGATIGFLFTAALAAAAVCVRERWDWLGFAACATVTPQWVDYLFSDPELVPTLLTLIGFGSAAAVGAVGFELRQPTVAVRPASVLLLALNGFLLAAVGWLALDQSQLWLVGLAGGHVAIGTALLRNPRMSRPVGIVAAALGAVLADLALLQMLDGPALTVSWAAATIGFAALVRFARTRGAALEDSAAGAGLAAHVALALLHALLADAPPAAILAGGGVAVAASGALAALAAACLTAGLVLADRPGWRVLLNGLGLAATAYLIAANLDGVLLVGAWATEAVVLAEIARRHRDSLALKAGLAHLGLASVHALAVEAPPLALLVGLADPVAAALALGACIVAAWRCATIAATMPAIAVGGPEGDDEALGTAAPRSLLASAATVGALLALHLSSAQLVTAAGAGAQAQTLLSVFWGGVGVTALLVGLLRDLAPLRTGALWLLLTALAKVFLYDLAALTPIARVVSFVVLGLLLLLGAFAWQRIRPRPLPDLRGVAAGTPE